MRYEFLVPTHYNEGKRIEPMKVECLQILLTEFFEGVSWYPGVGRWKNYPEEGHIKYEVNVIDDEFSQKFFGYFRRVLEKWFRQEQISMNRVPIDSV